MRVLLPVSVGQEWSCRRQGAEVASIAFTCVCRRTAPLLPLQPLPLLSVAISTQWGSFELQA